VIRVYCGVLSVALLSVLLPASATACVCYESEGLAAEYEKARAVFAGRVIALHAVGLNSTLGAGDMVATIEVRRRWKGPKEKLIRVRTCGTQATVCTCGTDFRLGAHYVVFGVGEPLATGSCQPTREYTPVRSEPGMDWLGVEDLVKELDRLAIGKTTR
jgi:hypothetical protein